MKSLKSNASIFIFFSYNFSVTKQKINNLQNYFTESWKFVDM